MIVKNEAHIIRESMSCTLPLIDTFSIVDTGSTDNTIEVIKDFYKEKGIEGVVHERPWKNFGHNRSESLKLCDGLMDYILVIDADDLMFFPSNAREILHKILEEEKPNGCCLNIHQGTEMKYMRGQIFKANDGWMYKGVVHEYPSNCKDECKMINLPPEFWMESRRLGGRNLTGDKMKRDIEALLKGIEEEPDNDRYYFYLAQSYRDNGNNEEAIKYYKKRFKMGRWYEEAWNSAYNVGECYRRIGNILKFEHWMQKAFEFHKARAEPLYHLVKYYRETNQFYKALHYINIVRKLSYPKNDVLFVEQFPNSGGIEYEASIVEYYVHPEKCLETTLKYMLLRDEYQDNCVSNLKFSVKPIISTMSPLIIPQVFGEDFRPSAISCFNYPLVNVRFVNYLPPIEGEYKTKDGSAVQTKNLTYNLESGEYLQIEDSVPLFDSSVKGLEDMRVYNFEGNLYYTATNYYEYLDKKISIVHGEYGKQPIGIESPTNSDCEKNWLNIPRTNEFIYSWNPLRIGKIHENKFQFYKEIPTPPLFKTFRGSASPVEIDGKLVALVHFCEYSKKRIYYHCFVELEEQTYRVLSVSFPFTFKSHGIEYCLSMRLKDSCIIECFVSFMDSNPHKVEINTKDIKWVKIVEKQKSSIISIPENTDLYWAGGYSMFLKNNHIEKFITNNISNKATAILFRKDCVVTDNELNLIKESLNSKLNNYICETDFIDSQKLVKDNNIPIICTLCSRIPIKKNMLLLPLDDDTFERGLKNVLSNVNFIDWDSKISNVFWRGDYHGSEVPSLRIKVCEKLQNNINCNVKLGLFFDDNRIPKEIKSERCNIQEHFKYKYLMIIDGTGIASNHQWIFGSGSVPIMITHPANNWWFKKYLIPMKHYVPINYDLSDLEEKIEWLIKNDDEAKQIAINALKFSEEFFTSEFQKNYIKDELTRIYNL